MAGAAKVMFTDVLLVLVATTAVGGSGTVGVVNEFESEEGVESPTPLVAITENV
ncbi:unannotated protein [freshwater metagenome]|uniref:Unannotated protein n=1 Tax=freshwater metagenome TaxID=449393 RepID=A0A6J6JWE9_9ZZZZ